MFKKEIVNLLSKQVSLKKQELASLLEVPLNEEFGDYAFPCFKLGGHPVDSATRRDADDWHPMKPVAGAEPDIVPSASGAIVQDGRILPFRRDLLEMWQFQDGAQVPGESCKGRLRESGAEPCLGLDVRSPIDPRTLPGSDRRICFWLGQLRSYF